MVFEDLKMPEIKLELSEAETRLLETIREQQGLETLDQVAEWLIKQRLRGNTQKLSGRNRALYPVKNR